MADISVGTLEGTLSLKDAFTGVLKSASASLKEFHKQFGDTMSAAAAKNEKFAESMEKTGNKFTKAGQSLLGVSVAAGAAIAGVAKVTIDYENSFAGVKKTVNGTAEEIAKLEQGFKDMAQTIPVSVNELHAIGEAAGQLGIKKENIIGFTRVMADLGVTTNLTSEEAASSLAKFANITGMAQTDFDRLGSTIVALGNNFATTEADIVSMATRLASSANQVGMTEDQIMAIAASLSSVGIEADAGGSAISKVMTDMALAVAQGGDQLKLFAEAAGMSSADFQKAFRDDAAGALASFMQNLSNVRGGGGENVLLFLEEMGISEVRMRNAILASTGAGKLMNETLKTGAQAWGENTALTKEAEARYATLSSQLTIAWNKLKAVGVEIGLSLLPSLKDMVKALDPVFNGLKKVAEWFATMPKPMRLAIAAVIALVAALAPLLLGLGAVAGSIGALAGVGVSGAMLLAFGKIILIIGAVVLALTGLYKALDSVGAITPIMNFLAQSFATVKQKLVELWENFGAPLWEGVTKALYQVGEAWKAIFSLIGAILSPLSDTKESVDWVALAFDALTIGTKIVMVVLTDVASIIQHVAWAAKEAAGWIEAMIYAWRDWLGTNKEIKLPEPPKSAWEKAAERPDTKLPGFDEMIKMGEDLDTKVTAKIGKTAEETKAAEAAAKAWAKAIEKAKEEILGINTENLQELNALATVYAEAMRSGATISNEAMISIGDTFKTAIDSLRAQGKEIPAIFQEMFEQGQVSKAAKEQADALGEMLGLSAIDAANKQATAYVQATEMGVQLSLEQMEALDAAISEGWQRQVAMGQPVSEVWKTIREEAAKLRTAVIPLSTQLLKLGEIPGVIAVDFKAMAAQIGDLTQKHKQMNATIREAQWTVYLNSLTGTKRAEAELVKEHEDMVAAAYEMAAAQNWTNEKLKEYLALIDQINGKKRNDLTAGAQIKANLGGVFDNLGNSISSAFSGGGGLAGAFKAIGTDIADAIAKPLTLKLKDMGKQVGAAVSIGIAGATGAGGAMGGNTGAMIGGMASTIGGAALGLTALGTAAKASMAAAVGLSAATMGIGLAAVGAYMAYKKFFTVSKEVKMMREEADKFQNSLVEMLNKGQAAEAGGERWKAVIIKVRDAYIRVGKTAEEAEDAVGRMWDTAHPEKSKKAIAEIAEVMNDFKMSLEVTNAELEVMLTAAAELGQKLPDSILDSLEAMAELGELTEENLGLLAKLSTAPGIDYKKFEEAAKRYNIDEAALGIEYVQFKSDEMAQQMINDFDLLVKGGASVGTVLGGMAEEISKLVSDSAKFGTEIPENFRPWISELQRTGRLVDENGNAITDLSNIKFGDSMATEFEKITSAIETLVEVIKNDLVSAINDIPSEIDAPKINNPNTGGGDAGGGGSSTSDDPGYASGTLGRHGQWFGDFGAGRNTRLHGDEAVITKSQAPFFAADVLGMTAAGATSGEMNSSGGGGKVTLPVTMVVGNKNVFLDIIMEQQDHRLALMGIRP